MAIDQDVLVCEVIVIRAVDERGQITDDPVRVVEGELEFKYTDGTSEIVNVFRNVEQRPAIVNA